MGQKPPYVDVLNNRCDRAAIENNILLFKGVLLSSARHPSLDALQ
jgi:hypothetical protein